MGTTIIPGGVMKGLDYHAPVDSMDLRLSRRANYLRDVGHSTFFNLSLVANDVSQVYPSSIANDLYTRSGSHVIDDFFLHGGNVTSFSQLLKNYESLEQLLTERELAYYCEEKVVLEELLTLMEEWPPLDKLFFRHLDIFLRLLIPEQLLEQLDIEPCFAIAWFGGIVKFGQKELAMLRELFATRDRCLKQLTERNLQAYGEVMIRLAVSRGIKLEAVKQLMEELFVELEWLRYT